MTTNRPRGFLVLLALLPALWLTSCSKSSTPGQTVSFISVSPTPIALFTGKTQQITVSAHYSDGSVKAVTSGVTFTASAPAVASVSAAGMVTAVGVDSGTGTVTAVLGDKTADMVINVLSNSVPVFTENYAHGVSFLPFGGSNNALTVDTAESHSGSASLRIAVPAAGYTGGALNAAGPPNPSLYNAVTFWAKASKAATLNVTGFGNDAMGGAGFAAESAGIPLTTAWVKHIIPIPALEKLTANVGLFHFAEGADEGAYTIWLDDIQYENLTSTDLGSVTSASVNWAPFDVEIGKSQALTATGSVTYTLPSVVLSNVSLRYFALTSSAPAVATVTANGLVSGVSLGTANLTAQLGTLNIPGAGVVTVIAPIVPTTAPPRPTVAADKVISLLSKAYTNVGVDTWGTSWSNDGAGANLTPLTIGGDDVKKYTQLKYVGIEFTGSNMINASSMTYLHLDIWTPNITDFHVKIVDFGANGVYDQNGDDTAVEVAVNATTTPALTGLKQWVSLDIPMASFAAMNKQHLAQLLFVSTTPYGAGTVYVDNVYFHNSAYIDSVPPTVVISDNVSGDTATGPVKFTFTFSEDIGTSFTDSDVVVTGVAGGTVGTLTKESNLVYSLVVTPATSTTGTINVSVAAGAFSDLANNASIDSATASQAYDTNLPTAPIVAPTRPTVPAANVISLLSDAYSNHAVDSWRAPWGGATVLTDVMVGADHVKKYTSLDFVGIQTETSMVDASSMKFVHLDVWTPDVTVFKLKLVDFGANGHWDGTGVADDVESELTFNSTSTPALVTGSWVSLDIPLSSFTSLTTRAHLAQYVLSTVGGGTVFIDNFYFYDQLPMDLPVVSFDSSKVLYGLNGFEGAQDSTIVTDPAGGTSKVAKVVKVQTAMAWAGTTLSADAGATGFPHKVPFDGMNAKMTVRVYSPDAGIPVRLVVENHSDNTVKCEADAVTTTSNAWETLTFDFGPTAATPANPAKIYDKVSIFFNFGYGASGWLGALTADKTYYFDDVAFGQFTTVTFDAATVAYAVTGFEGAENSTLVTDPAGGSNQVAKVMKSAGAQAWAGTTISLGTADNSVARIPLTPTSSRMLMRVYAPAVGTKVRLKVEKALSYYDANAGCETEVTTTTSGTWETLVFDFNNQVSGTPALDAAKTYNKISVFFDYGTADPAKAYYFDDLTFDSFTSPITFDSSIVTYSLAGFGGPSFEPLEATVVADPSGGANLVGKFQKVVNAQTWAGVVVSTGANFSIGKIPFSTSGTNNKMTLRVYSPASGTPVLLKFEDAASSGTISCEKQVNTTVSGAWETLTFDFTGVFDPAKTYNKAAIFFDFGTVGNGSTYYFDDLTFVP